MTIYKRGGNESRPLDPGSTSGVSAPPSPGHSLSTRSAPAAVSAGDAGRSSSFPPVSLLELTYRRR